MELRFTVDDEHAAELFAAIAKLTAAEPAPVLGAWDVGAATAVWERLRAHEREAVSLVLDRGGARLSWSRLRERLDLPEHPELALDLAGLAAAAKERRLRFPLRVVGSVEQPAVWMEPADHRAFEVARAAAEAAGGPAAG